jgi:geranylgeranyl pyrophosphate synthase
MGSDLEEADHPPAHQLTPQRAERDRRAMVDMIRNREFRNGHWSDVVRFVTDHGGVAYSQARSIELAERAEDELKHVPDRDAREALRDAVHYAVTRHR